MRNSLAVLILLAGAAPLSAQPWYAKPPVWAARETYRTASDAVHFRDRYWSVLAWSVIGAYTADMVTTKMENDRDPYSTEIGPLFKGTHATWNLSIGWGLIDGAALVTSHRLSRTHTGWGSALSAAPAFLAVAHAQAAYHNAGLPRVRP